MAATKLLGLTALAGAAVFAARRRSETNFSFRNKTVAVLGGSRGLGLEIARQLAQEGATVVVLGRGEDALDGAIESLKEYNDRSSSVECDIRDRAQVEAAITEVIGRYGKLDALFNVAGIIQAGPIEHMKEGDFEDTMATHFWGPYYAMMAAIPHMKDAGEGRIVNIASIGGKIAVPHLVPYAASKFALVGLSNGVRDELAKDHVYITTVVPGLMRTGSAPNAYFKGQQEKEFGLFSILASLPVTSVSAESAAAQIVEAARTRKPYLTISWQARAAEIGETLFPSLTARILQVYARLLPKATGADGDSVRTGWASQSPASDSVFVKPTWEAAGKLNQEAGREDHTQVGSLD